MNTTELVFEMRPEKNSGPEFVSSPQCTYMIFITWMVYLDPT